MLTGIERLTNIPDSGSNYGMLTSSSLCMCSLSCLGSGKVMAYTRWSASRFTSARQYARETAVTPTACSNQIGRKTRGYVAEKEEVITYHPIPLTFSFKRKMLYRPNNVLSQPQSRSAPSLTSHMVVGHKVVAAGRSLGCEQVAAENPEVQSQELSS